MKSNADTGVHPEPYRFTPNPCAWTADAGDDLPYRLVEAQYAADLAEAATGHDPAAHRRGRLEAVRAVDIAASQASALDLELLACDALRAFLFAAGTGITVGGPILRVRAAAAVLLGLMLEEWTTNSIKFGALGGVGRNSALRLQWLLAPNHVELSWRERGVPIVQSADTRRNGFGKYMVEHVLPQQLGAISHFALLPGGIDCTLILPKSIVAD
ncbi:hypothetical protein [uncultured Sphingomonas sp.]|uniref:hypothetical protein n=1 Tax=uncultured Sphingomonas sp. TaxID=158754 RepID=UPI0025D6E083|nr:hypothetical protein [uncultured Sphingomonas sp.]